MTEQTPRNGFRHLHRLRVRWSEVDMQRIVFNAHYLMYLDTAFADHWRALALPYEETLTSLGGDLYLRKATLEYARSARYDDTLEIGIRCAGIGTSSLRFEGAVFRQDDRLATGELIYVFADPATQTPRPVPDVLRSTLLRFEEGEPVLDVRTGDWLTLGADAQAVRTEVFVQEQRVPAEMEWDAEDAHCLHAVAYNRLGRPLATGRLLAPEPGVGKIGRMAVRLPARGGQVGRAVLEALTAQARARGDRELMLHAQISAAGFYARAGYVERGEPFEEAGIPHIEMTRAL